MCRFLGDLLQQKDSKLKEEVINSTLEICASMQINN